MAGKPINTQDCAFPDSEHSLSGRALGDSLRNLGKQLDSVKRRSSHHPRGERVFNEFMDGVADVLGSGATGKGYQQPDRDWANDNPTFDFVRDYVDGNHALGEIMYKVLRYKSRANKDDLIKIAAWAFLEWRFGDHD